VRLHSLFPQILQVCMADLVSDLLDLDKRMEEISSTNNYMHAYSYIHLILGYSGIPRNLAASEASNCQSSLAQSENRRIERWVINLD
jgi:hypothetical protein